MDTTVPIAALSIDRLSPQHFRDFVFTTDYGRCSGYLSLGPIAGFPPSRGDLLYRAPYGLLLRFISHERLSPETFEELLTICTWITTHPDKVYDAINAACPEHEAGDALKLEIRLISPGFTDDWLTGVIRLPYPTEVVQLGITTDALGRQCVIKRADTYRLARQYEFGRVLGRARQQKNARAQKAQPSQGSHISLGEPLRRSDPKGIATAELREVEALLWDMLPEPASTRVASKGPSLAVLSDVKTALGDYARLVALAARLLYAQTPAQKDTGRISKGLTPRRAHNLLRDVLPMLGNVSKYFSDVAQDLFGLQLPSSAWPPDLDLHQKKLASKKRPANSVGLSANWTSGVPRTFTAFLEELVPSSTDLTTPVKFDSGAQESAVQILGNAAIGVVAAVNAASACDVMWGWPEQFPSFVPLKFMTPSGRFDPLPELMRMRADLVRVVCAHRVMLEMVGLPDRSIAVSILGNAIRFGQELRGGIVRSDCDEAGRAEIWATGRAAIAVLRGKGTLRKSGRIDSDLLGLCMAQERHTRHFFEMVP